MKLLDKFEHSIERLMEGTTSGFFRQSLQPAEIGKKLERAMLSQKRASMGTSIVPNVFTVRLNPADYGQIEGFAQGLSRQMEAWLAQVATQQNLSVIDRIRVSFESDPKAKKRNPDIDASISDGRSNRPQEPASQQPARQGPPAQATSVYNVAPPRAQTASVRVTDGPARGTSFRIPDGSSTVGRSRENDLVIDSPDVSRRHARFEFSSGRLRIYDLNSTNGTRVNGDPVRVADLFNGDTIVLGTSNLVIEGLNDNAGGRW